MKHVDRIPIIYDDGNNTDILYLYTLMTIRLNGIDAVFQANTGSVVSYDGKEENRSNRKEFVTRLEVNAKIVTKVRDAIPLINRTDKYVVLMPFEVGNELVVALEKLPAKRKKTIARLFVYFYYKCDGYGLYSRGRELLLSDLKMDAANLSASIKGLVDKGFLVMTDYYWSSTSKTYAREYGIALKKTDEN